MFTVHEDLAVRVRVAFLQHEDVRRIGRRMLNEPPRKTARDPQRVPGQAIEIRVRGGVLFPGRESLLRPREHQVLQFAWLQEPSPGSGLRRLRFETHPQRERSRLCERYLS